MNFFNNSPKIMKNNFIKATLALFLLSSCAGNSFKYSEKPTTIVNGKSKYYVADVKIKFVEGMLRKAKGELLAINSPAMKKDFSNYPNEQKISEIVKQILETKLKEKGIYSSDPKDANAYSISMKADYERIGLLWSKTAYHSFIMSHDITVSKEGKEVARSVYSNYKAKRGYFAEFASNAKTLAGAKGSQDEIEDLNIVIADTAKELSELGLKAK